MRLPTFLLAGLAGLLSAQTRPASSGFDVKAIDSKASPCQDFFQYACGNWNANNPIPADQATWGRFNELNERNLAILQDILEKSASTGRQRTAVEQKIGDYFASCLDESAIEAKGAAPLRQTLDRINGIKDKASLAAEIARLHNEGVPVLFDFSSGPDAKNSSIVIAQADQGGLGLPDRDYYLKTDAKSVEQRKQYEQHVRNMFQLLGNPPGYGDLATQAVMRIETALAKASLDRVARRDPEKTYHKLTVQEWIKLAPAFNWQRYLTDVGSPQLAGLNVAVPEFFGGIEGAIQSASLDDWKLYLAWHALHDAAPLLPKSFVQENFNFYGKTLTGQKELRPRWKRCVQQVDAALGEALGQKFVETAFAGASKQKTLEMVSDIEKAMAKDIQDLSWMTAETKQKALEKLQAISNKIGYPDRFRDYSRVQVVRGDALGNNRRAAEFEFHRQLGKIGKPVDKNEWFMTPPTVNAYYDPQMNNINFPAGILQPPFYDVKLDEAVNYGGIGAVIGHELTHGFDDEGRQFDAIGNLRDWWTATDAKEFEKRAGCFVQEYGNFTAVGDVKLNGKLTLGENAADNGGVRIALMALMSRQMGKEIARIDGFTPTQRFFLGFAQVWCQNQRDEVARLRALTDPHSPGKYRVNGVMQNIPEFGQAFGCKTGDAMVSAKACRVW